jgi:hypothetical protein
VTFLDVLILLATFAAILTANEIVLAIRRQNHRSHTR